MIAQLVALSILSATVAAVAPSPFEPPAKPSQRIVRLLAPVGALDAKTLESFERETGVAIAYDSYDDPAHLQSRWRDGPYDVVALSGPSLAAALRLGEMRKLDRARTPNARRIAPALASKLAAYDAGGVDALAWAWTASGIVYDAAAASARLGAPPVSWSAALAPESARKLASCGLLFPDARDDLFVASFRLMGVDPGRATDAAVKGAADVLIKARMAGAALPSRDTVSALANGSACLAVGDAGEARTAAKRSRDGGAARDIRFVAPREGAAMTLWTLAMPRDAADADDGYRLLDYLLRPDIAQRNAEVAGLVSAETPIAPETLKTLWPAGAYDARLAAAIDKEWARVRASTASKEPRRQ